MRKTDWINVTEAQHGPLRPCTRPQVFPGRTTIGTTVVANRLLGVELHSFHTSNVEVRTGRCNGPCRDAQCESARWLRTDEIGTPWIINSIETYNRRSVGHSPPIHASGGTTPPAHSVFPTSPSKPLLRTAGCGRGYKYSNRNIVFQYCKDKLTSGA